NRQSGMEPRQVGLRESRDDLEARVVELDDAEAVGQGTAIARRAIRDDREQPEVARRSDQSRSRTVTAAIRTRRRRGEMQMLAGSAARRAQPDRVARGLEQAVRDWTRRRHRVRPLMKPRISGQVREKSSRLARASWEEPPHADPPVSAV